MLGSLDPIIGGLGLVAGLVDAFGDIFSGLAYFTGEDFAAALAKGFMP